MFNFWNPVSAASMQAGAANPYAQWSQMWPQGAAGPPPFAAANFGQHIPLPDAFSVFFDAMRNQGQGAPNAEAVEQLVKAWCLNPAIGGAQFNPMSPPIPQFPQMPAFASGAAPLAGMPALGINREWQQDLSTLHNLMRDGAECQKRFADLFSNFAASVSQRIAGELADPDQDKPDFERMCRIWIDCCEDEFQALASSKEYSSAYGAMLNAAMRIRRHVSMMMENAARLQNMPTRSEIDSLHQGIAQARDRETQLIGRIRQLEQEVERLGAKKPRARRTAASGRNK